MWLIPVILGLLGSSLVVNGLYSPSDAVVELTAANFQSKVIQSDEVWIVEFYAPWCGHCKSLAPEYKKAASALKGIVRVGAVDMDTHQGVGAPYNVRGFPTLKVFGANKNSPSDYNGQRTANGIVDAGLSELRKVANSRLSGGSGGGGGGGSSGGGGRKEQPKGNSADVIELTDSNFEELVLNSEDLWLVEFFAPWCGHCKNLEPQWKSAASQLKGKMKLGALDATVHTVMSNRFGVRGFPTIKFFPAGKKSASDAIDYDGGRDSGSIVDWSMKKVAENIPAPEVKQILNAEQVKESCDNHQLCIIAILPHILDCNAKCRNEYLSTLTKLGDKFKRNMWGWLWSEAAEQLDLEDGLGIGGFGYPAMAALNARKMKYAILKGSFGYDGINEFLRELSFGKGSTAPVKGAAMPKVRKSEAWDGKDGKLPEEEEIDLSDVDLDEKIEL